MKSYPVLYRIICFACILMMLSLPFESRCQEISDSVQAIADAKADAAKPNVWVGWGALSFLAAVGFGCLGGSAVIIGSQVMTPNPPTERFLGKSPEYISFYTSAYQNEARSKRLLHSSLGCLGGTMLAAIIWIPLYSEYEGDLWGR